MQRVWAHLFAVGVALDRLVNALLLGDPRETLSSRAHRTHRDGKPFGFLRHPINWLFFWQPDHCAQAHQWDRDWLAQKPLKD